MNNTFLTKWALGLAVVAALPFAADAQNKPAAEVETFFRHIDTVIGQRDAAAFERLLTDDFTFIGINGGILPRKDILERQKAGNLMAGTPNEILSVHVYNNSAIVTYQTKTPLNGGTTIIGTRVFVKQAGAWKWAYSHGTTVSGAMPGK